MRELVNNAYDADATEVYVEIASDKIVIRDNGEGMDLKGLKQYFIIGSDEKTIHFRSPRFGRARIGQFGIGKFAFLATAAPLKRKGFVWKDLHNFSNLLSSQDGSINILQIKHIKIFDSCLYIKYSSEVSQEV